MLTLYKTSTCRYCPQVIKYLDGKGAEYEVVDIEEDRGAAQKLWDLGYRTVPVVSDGNKYVAGPKFGEIAELLSNK